MNQCSFETVNYTSTGECQSVNYYSFFPQCVNKEGADINIPSHHFMWWNKLTGTDCGLLALMHQHMQTHTLFTCFILLLLNSICCYRVINHKKTCKRFIQAVGLLYSCDLWPRLDHQCIKISLLKGLREKKWGKPRVLFQTHETVHPSRTNHS